MWLVSNRDDTIQIPREFAPKEGRAPEDIWVARSFCEMNEFTFVPYTADCYLSEAFRFLSEEVSRSAVRRCIVLVGDYTHDETKGSLWII